MRELLTFLVAFAIFSNVLCLDLGRLLGLRRNWRDHSVHTNDPEIVEVVRWRQPVCVIAGPGVPPCFLSLRKYQNEYEKNSAKGLEEKQSKNAENEEKETEIKNKRETNFLHGIEDEDNLDKMSRSSETLTKVITPHVADYIHLENFENTKLEGSEESSLDDHTIKVRSSTPGIENARAHRQGRYLIISTVSSRTQTAVRTPPAISVTKVLNSPVTATLVANNCFPDIGVPLCDDYQETITIYKDPVVTRTVDKSSNENFISSSENDDHVTEASENHQENESTSNESSNLNIDDSTKGPQTRTGLLGQVVQHVINKPGVISAIPPVVIDAIANHPGILEVIGNIGQPESPEAPDVEIVTSLPSKPGLIGSFLDIQKPAILGNFGFNIFNKGSTTTEPIFVEVQHSGEPIVKDPAQQPDVETIQGIQNEPEVVGVIEEVETTPVIVIEETHKPGFFQNFWSPGNFGIFNKIPTIVTTEKSKDFKIEGQMLDNEETKSSHSIFVEKPETMKISEIFFKPENDISQRPSLPDIFTKDSDNEIVHEAKPTEAPGIFGGLFSNPARPSTVDESVENTKTLLGMGKSTFPNTPGKPLVIERPGEKLLLVEKPIFLNEKPSHTSELLNFFEASENESRLSVDHEIIKEPVYIYQKPQTATGIFNKGLYNDTSSRSGFFQGWAIFGNGEEKPSKNYQEQSKSETEEYSQVDTNLRVISEPTAILNPGEAEKSIDNESVKPKKISATVVDIEHQKSQQEENIDLIKETFDAIGAESGNVEEVSGSVVNVDEQSFNQNENIKLTEEAFKKSFIEPIKTEEVSTSIFDIQEQKSDHNENTEITEETIEEISTESAKLEEIFRFMHDVSEKNFQQEENTELTEKTFEEIPSHPSGVVEAEKNSEIDDIGEEKSQNAEEKIEAISTALEKNPENISTKSETPVDIPENIATDPNLPVIDEIPVESSEERANLSEINERFKEIEDTLDEFENV